MTWNRSAKAVTKLRYWCEEAGKPCSSTSFGFAELPASRYAILRPSTTTVPCITWWGAVLTVAVLVPEAFTRLMVETEADIGAVAATFRRVSFIVLFCLVQCSVLERCTPHHMI